MAETSFPKKKPRPPDVPSWPLTLADMMTLLLCFFILMVSVASVDRQKFEAMSEIMARTMRAKPQQARPERRSAESGTLRAPVDPLPVRLKGLEGDLAARVRDVPGLSLSLTPEAVMLNLPDAILFDSGRADLTGKARAVLGRIVPVLAGAGLSLTIEGHTDDIPIRSVQFPSNWELSGARGSAVARFFIERGFPPARVQVLGRADTRPLAPNLSPDGRPIPENQARNRRVTLLIAPEL